MTVKLFSRGKTCPSPKWGEGGGSKVLWAKMTKDLKSPPLKPRIYILHHIYVLSLKNIREKFTPPPMGGGESLKSKTDRPNIHLFRLKKDSL